MKRFLLIGALLLLTPTAPGQGTVEFSCLLQGRVLFAGGSFLVSSQGSLQLEGNLLRYELVAPLSRFQPAEAHFHGPAVNSVYPIISLAPFFSVPEGIKFQGLLTVPAENIPDLRNGYWYINLHSTNYENGVLSGFILPVPEPAVLVLSLVAGVLLVSCGARARKSLPLT